MASPCDAAVASIVLANVGVWGAWTFLEESTVVAGYDVRSVLLTHFMAHPGHPPDSLLLYAFSHRDPVHLYMNMSMFWNLAPEVSRMYGCRGFLGLYVGGALVSSIGGMGLRRLLQRPDNLSIGASGAVMALLGAFCINNPELQFAGLGDVLPHSFTALTAMKAMMVLDTLGLLLHWSLLDHAGHLSGMLAGIVWAKFCLL